MPEKDENRLHFEELMAQAAQGSQYAVWQLLDRYSSNILRVVRRHLPDEIRSKVDSHDIVQSVWKSLLRNPPSLATADAFIAYMAAVARNKVYETHRHFTKGQAFDVRREVSIAAKGDGGASNSETSPPDIADSQMDSPSAIAGVRELWSSALDAQGELGRRVIELRLQGLNMEEIADQLAISYATVRKSLRLMLESLSR